VHGHEKVVPSTTVHLEPLPIRLSPVTQSRNCFSGHPYLDASHMPMGVSRRVGSAKIYSTSKTWSCGPVHDPALRGSVLNGFAGIGGELFWSTGAPQLRISECGLRNFDILFELLFCIFNPQSEIYNPKCDDSSRLPQGGKSMEARSGGGPRSGPLGPDSLLV